MSTTTEHEPEETTAATHPLKQRNRWLRVLAVSALIVAGVGGTAFAWNSHVQGQYERRDEALSLARINADDDRRKTDAAHEREIERLEASHEAALAVAVEEAVAKEKRRGTRALRRAVRKQKARARREAAVARNAGYSSGTVAGYTSGHADGEDAGLLRGSDGLDCSDDFDVYWLPPCY